VGPLGGGVVGGRTRLGVWVGPTPTKIKRLRLPEPLHCVSPITTIAISN
jgi:hypothetical protein